MSELLAAGHAWSSLPVADVTCNSSISPVVLHSMPCHLIQVMVPVHRYHRLINRPEADPSRWRPPLPLQQPRDPSFGGAGGDVGNVANNALI